MGDTLRVDPVLSAQGSRCETDPHMIELTCTKCQTLLSLDDAFAGGVCRCRQCGAIQTVPSRLKPSAASEPESAASTPSSAGLKLAIVAIIVVIILAAAIYFVWKS